MKPYFERSRHLGNNRALLLWAVGAIILFLGLPSILKAEQGQDFGASLANIQTEAKAVKRPANTLLMGGVSVKYGQKQQKFAVAFRVPVSLMDAQVKDAINNDPSGKVHVVDQSKPVLLSNGRDVMITNISYWVLRGEFCRPKFIVTPFWAGPNKVGLRFKKVDFDAGGLLWLAKKFGITDEDKVLAQLIEGITSQIQDSMYVELNTALGRMGADGVNPYNLIAFRYDARTRTVYISLSDDFLVPIAPRMKLTSFTLSKTDVTLAAATNDTVNSIARKNNELAFDQNSVNFILHDIEDQSLSFMPGNLYPGGVLFGQPGENDVTVSMAVKTPFSLPFSNQPVWAAVSVTAMPRVTAKNTVSLTIKRIHLNWLGQGKNGKELPNVPDFIQNHKDLQNILVNQAAQQMASNPAVRKYAATSCKGNTVTLKLKKSAMLPAFAQWFDITGMDVNYERVAFNYTLNMAAAGQMR